MKKSFSIISANGFLLLFCIVCVTSYPRGKEYRKIGGTSGAELVPSDSRSSVTGEPSCEELRAMWRFSRRQSRAAEITNEIPTFRDPFAYNIWEQYPRARSVVSQIRPSARSKFIYGRVVQNAPHHRARVGLVEQNSKAMEDVLRYLENPHVSDTSSRRKHASAFRLSGSVLVPSNRLTQTGSFQHLKELIWAERAKELQQQRLLEEAAARSAALKDVKVPAHYSKMYPDSRRSSDGVYNAYDYNRGIGLVNYYDIGEEQAMRDNQARYRKLHRPRSDVNLYEYMDTPNTYNPQFY